MQSITNSKSVKLNGLMSLMIHFFKKSAKLFEKVKSEEFKVNIHYKQANEKFTEADFILQKMFENYLSKYYSQIQIIGEEDTSTELIKESEYYDVNDEVNFNAVNENDIPEEIREVNTDDIALFIDPIDSTEQFIKRNFGPVTSLVGLTLNSKAFIGFIYFPYYKGEENNSLVFFNIPTKGVFSYNTQTEEIQSVKITKNEEDKWIFISSGTRTNERMKNIFALFEGSSSLQVHGLGEKALQCVLNDYVYLANGKGLGLWDVCAGHALIKEVGGNLCYMDGSEVLYSKDSTDRKLASTCFMTNNVNRIPKFLGVLNENKITFE